MEQDSPNINTTFSYIPQDTFFICSDTTQEVKEPAIVQSDRKERLRFAINDLQIGRRIRQELKRQGRSVAWLAQQLCMERTSLYYTFRQNSIDVETLLRISYYLEHDFLKDVADVYKKYGL